MPLVKEMSMAVKLNQTNIHTDKICDGFEEMEGVIADITGKEKIKEAS